MRLERGRVPGKASILEGVIVVRTEMEGSAPQREPMAALKKEEEGQGVEREERQGTNSLSTLGGWPGPLIRKKAPTPYRQKTEALACMFLTTGRELL